MKMTMIITIRITLLPCNTWSILSNGITSTGYIQNQSIVYKKRKEKYMAKGTRSRSLCVPISLEIYLYEGAIGTEQCKCNGINYHFISYALQVIAILNYEEKILLFLATTIREETKHGHQCGGITTLIKIQVDNRSSFEFRSNLAKNFLKVPMAQSVSICDRIKFQIQAPE